jgi:hypothetical protein
MDAKFAGFFTLFFYGKCTNKRLMVIGVCGMVVLKMRQSNTPKHRKEWSENVAIAEL